MTGLYKPSSARSPDTTAVANGIPKRVQRTRHQFNLRPRRVIFAVAKLHQAAVHDLVVADTVVASQRITATAKS